MNYEDTYINNKLDRKIVSLIKEKIGDHLEVNPNDNDDFLVERDVPIDVYSFYDYYPTQKEMEDLLGPDDSAEYEANYMNIVAVLKENDPDFYSSDDGYDLEEAEQNVSKYMNDRASILVQDAITEYKKDISRPKMKTNLAKKYPGYYK